MRILTEPNWSFGRDGDLLKIFRERLDTPGITVHYLKSNIDHNRTITAFSGEHAEVGAAIIDLCNCYFPRADLNRHHGSHPRIGALDVCPFVCPEPCDNEEMLDWVERIAKRLADRFEIPVFLYEKSEKGRHEADLPALRKGGFGGLAGRVLNPDFGPEVAHVRLGASVIGWRDFLTALYVTFDTSDLTFAKAVAKDVRRLRSEGDPRFLGARCFAMALPSEERTQIALNLSLPDITTVDPILEWIYERAVTKNVRVIGPELVGVIRDEDLKHATRLPHNLQQVIETH